MTQTVDSAADQRTGARGWLSADGTRLVAAYPTEHSAREAMLGWFQGTGKMMLCVDVTPVLRWLAGMSDGEVDKNVGALLDAPVRPPAELCVLAAVVPTTYEDRPFGVFCVLVRSISGEGEGDGRAFITQCVAGDTSVVRGGATCITWNDDGVLTGWGDVIGEERPDNGVLGLVSASLSMFHVKNIGYREVRFPRHLRRRANAGGLGPTVYRTLTLRPFSENADAVQRGQMPTGEVPLHLVRGHFATYSPERKLFGKYVGTFWRPEHLAGNASVAVVKKTYAIQPATVQ